MCWQLTCLCCWHGHSWCQHWRLIRSLIHQCSWKCFQRATADETVHGRRSEADNAALCNCGCDAVSQNCRRQIKIARRSHCRCQCTARALSWSSHQTWVQCCHWYCSVWLQIWLWSYDRWTHSSSCHTVIFTRRHLSTTMSKCNSTTQCLNTQTFNSLFSTATQVSRYQKDKTNVDSTEARDSEWQWHQLGHMQACTSLQTKKPCQHPTSHHSVFLQAGCPSCRPTNSIKALKANIVSQPGTISYQWAANTDSWQWPTRRPVGSWLCQRPDCTLSTISCFWCRCSLHLEPFTANCDISCNSHQL